MEAHPRNIKEWRKYIQSLKGRTLRSKAIAANQVNFVWALKGEGYSPKEIAEIFRMFAMQFQQTGQALPTRIPGGYINYADLMDTEEFVD